MTRIFSTAFLILCLLSSITPSLSWTSARIVTLHHKLSLDVNSLAALRKRSPTHLFSSSLTEKDEVAPENKRKIREDTLDLSEEDRFMNASDLQTVQDDQIKKKIINAVLLAACFGYAAYTIFNIDHGMTRGWTQSEIAMRIPLDNWASYESSLEDRPIFTKTLINVIIYLLGDWLSQTLFQKKNVLEFDASRTLKNGFIGLCFGPLVHEYYQFSDYILPVEGGIWNRLEKILMDQTLYLTVKCSVYIAAVGLLQGESWEQVQDNVKSRIKGIVFAAWKFWPLVHCITYSVIPAQHRILWVNSVDLVWNAILASMSNEQAPSPDKDETESLVEQSTDPKVVSSNVIEINVDEAGPDLPLNEVWLVGANLTLVEVDVPTAVGDNSTASVLA